MDRFGRLQIMSRDGRKATAICDCGTIKDYWYCNVSMGKTKSCGCINRKKSSERYKALRYKHGKSNHPLYKSYQGMLSRCYYVSNPMFYRYGGRGILVCDEWKGNFEVFYEWGINNGWGEGLQVDRINNDLNYYPENCRFVSRSVNCRKRRTSRFLTIGDCTKTLIEWCNEYSICHSVVINRIKRGWSTEDAIKISTK